MSMFVCGSGSDFEFPDLGIEPCCMDSAIDGPERCSCWTPVYEPVDQEPPRASEESGVGPEGGCVDCAYRADSPERQGDDLVVGDAELLDELVVTGQPFWCHQGIRRPVKFVHPSGAEFVPPGIENSYEPPIIDGRPFKGDGSPADLCAGWAQRRARHLEATGA